MLTKKKFLAVVATLFVLVLSACGQAGNEEPVENADGEKKEVLEMATSADFPPFETMDETTGEIVGFDVDIAKYITNKLGYELDIKDMKFDGLVGALQANRVDFVIAGMSATAKRQESVDFSIEYNRSGEMFVTLKDSDISSIQDLAGKKIGVQLGTIQAEGAKKIAEEVGDLEIKALDKVNDLIQELKTNRIEAAYLDKAVAEGYIKELDLAGFDDPTSSSPGMAVAFPKGSELVEDFNKVLKEMQENGELDKLKAKWLEENK